MAIKRSVLVLLLLSFFCDVYAQRDSVRVGSVRYSNNFLMGGILSKRGEGTTFTFSTTNGIRYKRLAAGLGMGYDAYLEWRALPVFISTSYDFGVSKRNRNNALFIQFNYGYATTYYAPERDGQPEYTSTVGLMFNPNIGYRIKADKFRIYIQAGYKHQRNSYQYDSWWWGNTGSTIFVDQKINRMVVQLGFGLN